MSACTDPEDPLRISDQTRSLGLVVSRTQIMQQHMMQLDLWSTWQAFIFGKHRYAEEQL